MPGGHFIHQFHFHAEPEAGRPIPFLPVGEIKGVGAAVHEEAKLTKGRLGISSSSRAPEAVFGALLPHYLNYKMYQVLLEAKASEHSSRMVAMKNATDNAKQLVKDLTLEYNKLRQAKHHEGTFGNHQRRDGDGLGRRRGAKQNLNRRHLIL